MTLDQQIADFIERNQGSPSGFGWNWSTDSIRTGPPAESYADWRDNLTYDMKARSDPTNIEQLPWFLLNPWESVMPPEYQQYYGSSYEGVVAAQKHAYQQSGNTLPPPEAWEYNPGSPPQYAVYTARGAQPHDPRTQYKVYPDGSYEPAGVGQSEPGLAPQNETFGFGTKPPVQNSAVKSTAMPTPQRNSASTSDAMPAFNMAPAPTAPAAPAAAAAAPTPTPTPTQTIAPRTIVPNKQAMRAEVTRPAAANTYNRRTL